MKTFLLFILVFSLSACDPDSNSPYAKKTEIFSNYLQKQFGNEIPVEKHLYFILPDQGCYPCNKAVIEKFEESLNHHTNLSMVVTSSPVYLEILPKRGNILIDEERLINRLNLGIGGVGFITTENQKITKIWEAKQTELNLVDQFLFDE